MNKEICPNIAGCRLVNTGIVVPDENKRSEYVASWCKDENGKWQECKRFISKKELGFCPDFVIPDSPLSIDGIIDKFEENKD